MEQKVKKDAIFLIDGSSILYRSYYAIHPLHTSHGVPVQAIYGFCRTIKKMIDDFNPKKILLIWDSRGKTFRSEIYESYKTKRLAPPSDLFEQKSKIVEFADLIGLSQLAEMGLEADDLIASAADTYSKHHQIVIVSQDKDLRQLISENVIVYDPIKKEFIDKEKFIQENGFEPQYLLLYYSLLGDEVDNIPGVPGIGKKTAQELTIKYRSLENLYKHLDSIPKESLKNKLIEGTEKAFLSESLFKLKIVPIKLSLQDIDFNKENLSNAIPLFKELEFVSLLKEVEKMSQKNLMSAEIEAKETLEEKLEPKGWNFTIIRTYEQLDNLIKNLKEKKFFSCDTETTGLAPLVDSLVGISFAFSSEHAFYIPLGHRNQPNEIQLNLETTLAKLRPVMESESIHKTFHHVKFDQLVLWNVGIDVKGVIFDSLIAAYLLKIGEQQKIGLKFLSKKYFNETMIAFSEITDKKYKTYADVPVELGARYSAHDSLQTYKLKFELEKELANLPSLKNAFEKIEMPISQILFKIERFGVLIDPSILEEVKKKIDYELSIIENKILAAINIQNKNIKINLNSPKQLEELLFDELGLPVIKKSAKGTSRSTDQEVLNELSKLHPIPGMIIKYRELFKLKSTYVEPLPLEINSKTNRIHTTYSQIDAVTGRLASSNPNMQNIPASGFGLEIRSAFIASKNKVLMSVDYSQIELRVLAQFSGDKNLVKAFKENHDIHAQTAAQIFDIPIHKVTSKERTVGKRINFSIMYGLTPFGLSKDLGIKPREAKEYITKYFKEYPGIEKWMEETVEKAKITGYVETLFGRRRYIPGLNEKNKIIYEQARRIAVNTPVQGTSAELIKLAMIDIDKMCEKNKLKTQMIIQIHDELVFEVPEDEVDIAKEMAHSCMENIVEWNVPLKISVRFGKNWAEITK